MTLSMFIPLGLLLMIVGRAFLATKKRPKMSTALLAIGTLLVIGTIVVIGLATSSM